MVSITTLTQGFIFTTFFVLTYAKTSATHQTEACNNYAICLEKLEEKQRECREFRPRIRSFNDNLPTINKCNKKQNHELHSRITGLHLRKTEKTRDCIRRYTYNAEITVFNETVSRQNSTSLEKKMLQDKKCWDQFSKLISVINSKSIKKLRNKKSGKRQRKTAAKRDERKCQRERKILYRKCHKIATCCSLVPRCQKTVASLLNQIANLKTTLKENRVHCKTRSIQ